MVDTEQRVVVLASTDELHDDLLRLMDLMDLLISRAREVDVLHFYEFRIEQGPFDREQGPFHEERFGYARRALSSCDAFIYLFGKELTTTDEVNLHHMLAHLRSSAAFILIDKRPQGERDPRILPGRFGFPIQPRLVLPWPSEQQPSHRELLRYLEVHRELKTLGSPGDSASYSWGIDLPPETAPRRPAAPADSPPETAWRRRPASPAPVDQSQAAATKTHASETRQEHHEPSSEALQAPQPGRVYSVWFGTNRKPNHDLSEFLPERNDRITRGRVDVFVPKAHRFAETGTPFWRRLLRFSVRDDHLTVRRIHVLERNVFYAEIRARMDKASKEGDAHALVFLHGFNVAFRNAAIRAAQIGFDLSVRGATAFFSWPSCGDVASYPADEACIEASEPFITEFLTEFAAHCGAKKIHLIAHSMGNRGLLRALHRIAARAEDAANLKFDQIVLAAPDIDRDLFVDLASIFGRHARRTTLYASAHDVPVWISRGIHKASRAGYYPPHTVVPGIDTVEVPDFDVELLGHSYFANAAPLLNDIFDLMRHGSPPQDRQRIERVSDGNQVFWRLRR